MSATSPGTPTEDTGPSSTGPGHLLRSARESAGIAVREVSAQLRLDERTVCALENDDFKDLPAPTFVRGYLRGYARLLGVPVGPVMEAYDREGFNPPDLVADIAETPDASTRDFPVRLASLGVVAALVILVVLWWNNQAFNDLPAPVTDPTAAPGIVVPLTPGAPSDDRTFDRSADMQGGAGSRDESGGDPLPVPEPRVAATPEPSPPASAAQTVEAPPGTTPAAADPRPARAASTASAGEGNADQVIARAEDVLERTRNEVNAIVGSAGPSPSGSAPGAASPSTESAPASAQPPAQEPSPAATSTPQGAGSTDGGAAEARLVMRFPIEAWVEVYDRNDRRMFYNLAKPGGVVDVSGEPPIRILLGRTRGVSVSYNGEAVDLAPFTERGVARLTLGQ